MSSLFEISYKHFIWFVECFIISFSLLNFFRKEIFNKGLEFYLVITGFVGSLISCYLILNPELNLFLRTEVIESLDVDEFKFRGFAIAESVSFSYGVIQGILLGFCFYLSSNNKLFLLPIVFFIISILFNARIGFVFGAIGLLYTFISGKINFKLLITVLILILIFIQVDLFLGFSESNEETLKWGLSFFTETSGFVSGNVQGFNTYEVLSDMLFLPSNLFSILLGEGVPFGEQNGIKSDIGYVNQIFFGGFFYLLLLLCFLFFMYYKFYKSSIDKFYPLFFILSLLILNFKWDSFFVPSGFFRLFAIIYVYQVLKNRVTNSTLEK